MLIANGVRLSSQNPMRQLAAASAGSADRANWSTSGKLRCSFSHFDAVVGGYPSGLRHPASWCMAPDGGALSAESELSFAVSNTGAGAMGVNGEGSASITITNADAQLQLVVSASGTVSISITTDANLVGALYGTGTTAITVSNGTATLGALAGLFGNAAITFTASGTATAIGWLEGDIVPYTELSPQSLAAAVWNAVAADSNEVGTMGEKLNDAGSGSNPWTEVIEGGLTAAEILRILASVAAGRTTITDNGDGTATVEFIGLDDATTRVTAEMTGSDRTAMTLDGT